VSKLTPVGASAVRGAPERGFDRNRNAMTKAIPTRRGDVLILATKDSNFRVHAVGPDSVIAGIGRRFQTHLTQFLHIPSFS
jgi:hypothetical protein